MVSDEHDLSTIQYKGNLCLWQMLIVITQMCNYSTNDMMIQPMLEEAKSLAAAIADDCPLPLAYC